MTENEALESALKKIIAQEKSNWGYIENFDVDENWAVRTAIEHVKQYRKIGTVEELKATSKYLHLAKKHGTVGKAIEACTEYEGIGTVEECREAMKKKSEKPMAELGVFGNPEEKDIGRLEALHHKILYSKLAESVTEQEMIALLRAKDAVRKQIRKPVKNPYGISYIWKAGYCPVCGCGVTARWDYCQCCGQKLEWEETGIED